ncbi:DpnD/PcfM family protein [Enterocloster citroniae]|uniref:DpnD/PcfM-like C-terminal domain-containing protein n=1 Tax=[Clostridium] citroniae WAL-17108 TaxID=742733 RepID=G5HEM7_9FIRM|nr:DpnD/PcfM family protein [Enterocloster citroniae]EHE99985.1 hypothetical protein HMPREF9469_00900 [ [[Clostridium] citroniae WAL-17108]MCC3383249.1 hypothetical protein [Enterocloster citroniae]
MGRYAVSVREIFKRTVIVNAENSGDAIRKVEDAVGRDEILLDLDDFDYREIVPSDHWKNGEIPDGEDVSYYWHLKA